MHRKSLKLSGSLEKISVTRVQRTNGRSNLCVTKKDFTETHGEKKEIHREN